MAKIALLIGVGESQSGLPALPGTQRDIKDLERVLKSPKVGAFDEVTCLHNPDRIQMELAIEQLFTQNRQRDDLVLLYFSGHGIKSDDGRLYLASANTQLDDKGEVFRSTAVPTDFIQVCMTEQRSRSRRKVLILDSCFSGAVAEGMTAKVIPQEVLDIEGQLGGEGRAVLTSSTSTQMSYEEKGRSIYTRYVVEGLETGAADLDSDGQIQIQELHAYAKGKIQVAEPNMKPEIYAVQEGFRIVVASAPKPEEDKTLIYRKELDAQAKRRKGKLSPIQKQALQQRWEQLGLKGEQAQRIETDVLKPYQEFQKKCEDFDKAIQEALEFDSDCGPDTIEDLHYYQQVLQLREQDVTPIFSKYNIELEPPQPGKDLSHQVNTDVVNHAPYLSLPSSTLGNLVLRSEAGVNYAHLRDLLSQRKWKEADQETADRILDVSRRVEAGWLTAAELDTLPCDDLLTMDSLWLLASDGHFGFRVQKSIWQECGAPSEYNSEWETFGDRIGWRLNGEWVRYSGMTFDLSAPAGHLPLTSPWTTPWLGWPNSLGCALFFTRIQACQSHLQSNVIF